MNIDKKQLKRILLEIENILYKIPDDTKDRVKNPSYKSTYGLNFISMCYTIGKKYGKDSIKINDKGIYKLVEINIGESIDYYVFNDEVGINLNTYSILYDNVNLLGGKKINKAFTKLPSYRYVNKFIAKISSEKYFLPKTVTVKRVDKRRFELVLNNEGLLRKLSNDTNGLLSIERVGGGSPYIRVILNGSNWSICIFPTMIYLQKSNGRIDMVSYRNVSSGVKQLYSDTELYLKNNYKKYNIEKESMKMLLLTLKKMQVLQNLTTNRESSNEDKSLVTTY